MMENPHSIRVEVRAVEPHLFEARAERDAYPCYLVAFVARASTSADALNAAIDGLQATPNPQRV